MLQGTSSSAGKSLLAAGLCRVFARRGVAVAPFKAQNMSLNSWVTEKGEEMGIAQAIQARACFLEPDSRMNPLLLKPVGEQGSQIVVRGKAIGTMPYSRYIKLKQRLWLEVEKAYEELSAQAELTIIEGAGSPAEINLSAHEIVNMAVARHTGARVLLVSDIDRGGSFAALAGTMLLLEPADRNRIGGFILNKFRGDKTLLEPALAQISALWQTPFAGIMPMLENLRLPEEDSANIGEIKCMPGRDCLDIAIVNLPAMSNMADWDPLFNERGVSLRLVRHVSEFGRPDLVILPGSRNVPEAARFLRESGLACALAEYASSIRNHSRGNIVGICAGLLLLGSELRDFAGLEQAGIHSCLGLLPFSSSLQPPKHLARISGRVDLGEGQYECEGYEIHHGQVDESAALREVIWDNAGKPLGFGDKTPLCRIWGTWLHGIFDAPQFRHAFLNRLRREADLQLEEGVFYNPDAELDRLADAIESNLDMELILSLLA